jgi:LPXTG-motif cell wall-anchored protein
METIVLYVIGGVTLLAVALIGLLKRKSRGVEVEEE